MNWKGSSRALYILRGVPPLRSFKGKLVFAVLGLGALLAWYAQRETAPGPAVRRDKPAKAAAIAAAPFAARGFDFYLLALTVHAAFCTDGHGGTAECQARAPRPLVIHGLWPENRVPRTYPHDCPAPPLNLDPGRAQELEDYMPGVQAGLHEHEWREHGACSGLDADSYFRRSLELARAFDTALSARLTTLAGEEASAAQLRESAEQFHPGIGATFTLHCHTLKGAPPALRDRPFLVEIRQCVDKDGPGGAPGSLLDCARVDRYDQGCGGSFRIARMQR
jgi:ribonuclease T2